MMLQVSSQSPPSVAEVGIDTKDARIKPLAAYSLSAGGDQADDTARKV
jgi:hypothetical protein